MACCTRCTWYTVKVQMFLNQGRSMRWWKSKRSKKSLQAMKRPKHLYYLLTQSVMEVCRILILKYGKLKLHVQTKPLTVKCGVDVSLLFYLFGFFMWYVWLDTTVLNDTVSLIVTSVLFCHICQSCICVYRAAQETHTTWILTHLYLYILPWRLLIVNTWVWLSCNEGKGSVYPLCSPSRYFSGVTDSFSGVPSSSQSLTDYN